ncbi:MAG: dihydrolipoyl dehydrogenase [bacterium]
MSNTYDVAVVGGGPGGYVAAIRAGRYGMKTVLFEGEALGGTCLNWGCIPTKAMLHSCDLLHAMAGAGKLGIDLGGAEAKPDMGKLYAYKNKAVKKLTGGVKSLLQGVGVEIVTGTAELADAHTLRLSGSHDATYTANNIVLAMGSQVVVPPIPGLAEAGYWTSRSFLADDPDLPDRMIIIGGGVIGVEFAGILNDLGVNVTVVEMMEQLLPRMDAEVADTLRKSFNKAGIAVETGVKVTAVAATGGSSDAGSSANGPGATKGVTIQDAEGERTLEAQEIMVAVGRSARTDMVGLDAAGVRTTKTGILADDNQQTSVPHIYAIGDVTGRRQLAHAASADALAAVDHIAGKANHTNRDIVASCVYTRPEVATVGMTLEEAREAGHEATEGSFPIAANSKSSIMGETTGFVKIVSDQKSGAILGAHLIGPRVTDLVAELALAMSAELTVEEVGATIHPHPTVSEAVMEAIHDIEGLSVHKPVPRRT